MASKSKPNVTKLMHVQEGRLRTIVREESKTAAEGALASTLLKLGVRTETQEDIIETQKDMAYLRSWRKAVQAGGGRAGLAIVSLVILGVIAAVLAAIGIKLPGYIPTS